MDDESAENASSGTVPVNGKRVVALRKKKGWSQSTFARRSGCSLRTIKKIEKSTPVYPSTLEKIAGPLGVAYEDLTAGVNEVAPPQRPQTGTIAKLYLYLGENFASFDESQMPKIVQEIRKNTGASEVHVIQVIEGSVIITLGLSQDDAKRVFQAFYSGRLFTLGIIAIGFPAPEREFARECIGSLTDNLMLGIDRISHPTFEIGTNEHGLIVKEVRDAVSSRQKRKGSGFGIRSFDELSENIPFLAIPLILAVSAVIGYLLPDQAVPSGMGRISLIAVMALAFHVAALLTRLVASYIHAQRRRRTREISRSDEAGGNSSHV